jgi:transcriptional regulator with XRE-family HTH domain
MPVTAEQAAGVAMYRHRLGCEIKKLRESAGLRMEDVAAVLDVVPGTCSRMENGLAPVRVSYIRAMLDTFGVSDPGQRQRLEDLARAGQGNGWWTQYGDVLTHSARAYLDFESCASVVRSFSVLVLPDLAQTPDYARAVLRLACPRLDADQVARLVAVKMRRQETALARPDCALDVIIDESALLRVIGSPAVMKHQMEHLAALAGRPPVTVRVAPLNGIPLTLSPPFTVLGFAEPDLHRVGFLGEMHGNMHILRKDTDTAHLADVFRQIRRSALTADESARLITHLAETGQ